MVLSEDILLRILIGIIAESIVFIACVVIITILLIRYEKSKKKQLGYMVIFFILYANAIITSIIGKILTYITKTFDLDKTEWGLFTNWSFSLGFIAISLYFQLEVAWVLFPPKIRQNRLYAGIGSIILFLFVFAIPRYGIDGLPLYSLYPLKFILVFIYLLAASLYYILNSYRVYTFIRNKFLQKRILSGLMFYGCVIMVFIFFMISSIYGIIKGIYYTWGYFIAVSFMFSAAITGYFYVKQGKESDRYEIDEELQKLVHFRKKKE